MKKSLILIIFSSLLLSKNVIVPMIGMRFDNIAGENFNPEPKTCFGFTIGLNGELKTGFDADVDGNNFRLYLEKKNMKIGLSNSENGTPKLTFGGLYILYPNLNLEIDYILSKWDPDENDALRLALTVPL